MKLQGSQKRKKIKVQTSIRLWNVLMFLAQKVGNYILQQDFKFDEM